MNSVPQDQRSPDERDDALAYAHSIVETVREPLVVLDAQLRVRSANRSFYQTFRLSPQETEGQRLYDLGNGQWDIPRLRRLLEEDLSQNTALDDVEVESDFPAIGPKVMLLNVRKLGQKGAEQILLAIEDVTERRQLEAQRQALETRFTSLIKHIKDHAIFGPDPEGRITSWNLTDEQILGLTEAEVLGHHYRTLIEASNAITWSCPPSGLHIKPQPAWMAFTGQSAEEMLGVGWTKAVHPDDRDGVATRWKEAVARGEPFTNEHRIRRHDGQWRWMHVQVAPIRDSTGRITEWIGMNRDITARKQAEAESERLLNEAHFERDRLAALLASIQDEVWLADTQGRFTLANPAALKEMRADLPIEVKTLAAGLEVFWPDGSPRPIEATPVLRALNEGNLINEEEIIRTPASGELRYRQVSAAPVRDQNGGIIGAVAVVRDITERKQAEQALHEAHRRKDAFLATLSHELRNPLAPLRTSLDLLQARRGDGAADDALLQIMDRQLSHLVRLVDDLLDLSRINNDKIELRKEWLDLAQITQAALEICDGRLRQDGRQLSVNLPAEPLMVEGDRVRLVQIITNLLNNAAKFTEPGGQISLGVVPQEDQILIRVQDDGRGIPAEQLELIFEPFAQTEAERGCGLGLGLTLVRSLVALHGGTVVATSEGSGCGATVSVSLPRARCAQSAPGELDRADRADPDPMADCRVLVVDDNPDVAEAQQMLLTALNAEVRVAHGGAEALQIFADWLPTHVLMDIGMPGMDGYEVARRLRAQHAERAFRLIAATGWGQDEDRRRAQEAGFDQLLLKPVRAAELKAVLSTMDGVLDGIAVRHQ